MKIVGIVGILWSIAWFFFASDSPDNQRCISKKEREYVIEETRDIAEAHKAGESNVPWKGIFTSKACIGLFIGHSCSNWGTYLFLTNIPTYMKVVLKFDIKSVIKGYSTLSCFLNILNLLNSFF